MTTDNYKLRLHYETLADKLTLAPLWRRYAAELALALCGEDESAAQKFFEGWKPEKDPLSFKKGADEAVSNAQAELCLPLIEAERQAFIKAEHGRLQAVVGMDYWDAKTEETKYFHMYIEDGREAEVQPDPYDLSLSELASLPDLVKRVERIGTVSYLAFFNIYPRDTQRLKLLDGLQSRLTHCKPCSGAELAELFDGHDAYLDWKLNDPVRVIM